MTIKTNTSNQTLERSLLLRKAELINMGLLTVSQAIQEINLEHSMQYTEGLEDKIDFYRELSALSSIVSSFIRTNNEGA